MLQIFDAGLFSSVRDIDTNEPAQAQIPDPGLTQPAASHELHPAASVEQSRSTPSDTESLSNCTQMEEIPQEGFTQGGKDRSRTGRER